MKNKSKGHHPFYGHAIVRRVEAEYIKKLLQKYRQMPVNEELKKQIWDELQMEKHFGRITIPFKLVVCRDLKGEFSDQIEIILDTKV